MFQVSWFACILAPISVALGCTALFLIIHFMVIEEKLYEVMLIAAVSLVGYSLDLLFSYAGFIQLNKDHFIPLYLFCLWISFAATLSWSSAILVKHKATSVITGLLAPMSYLAAQRLGKIEYSGTILYSVCLHAVIWVVLMLIVHYYVIILKKHRINAR